MAVFRIERTRDYTVMSNHHLRNANLSLKAKGLLSMMLSLPEDWNYTTRGLAKICKEGVDAIGAALRELEATGYIVRHKLRDRQGRISDTEYVIYEQPQLRTAVIAAIAAIFLISFISFSPLYQLSGFVGDINGIVPHKIFRFNADSIFSLFLCVYCEIGCWNVISLVNRCIAFLSNGDVQNTALPTDSNSYIYDLTLVNF